MFQVILSKNLFEINSMKKATNYFFHTLLYGKHFLKLYCSKPNKKDSRNIPEKHMNVEVGDHSDQAMTTEMNLIYTT